MGKTIRFIILDELADGPESIVQIQEYYRFLLNRDIARDSIIPEIESLLKSGHIKIGYPADTDVLEKDKIEDYWFDLTESGRQEQETMSFPRSLRKHKS